MILPRRRRSRLLAFILTIAAFFYLWSAWASSSRAYLGPIPEWRNARTESYFWKAIKTNYPPKKIRSLPTNRPVLSPKIQAEFGPETAAARSTREERRQAIKETFGKCWASYRRHAWTADELAPVSGGRRNPFGGWAATLVDSLDTMWIMGMYQEFDEAVQATEGIDFTRTNLREVNIFETTIRYLGGFIAAYDLSGDVRLLRKAAEVGEMIYRAFDTPNRMPITRWDMQAAAEGAEQSASLVLLAEIGSLSLELTRLSQITGDPKWFDAAQRVMDVFAQQQDSTAIPGLWPLRVDAGHKVFDEGSTFTLGAMADSIYEYLPKMSCLLGGQLPVYQTMYQKAADAAARYTFFRPMTPKNEDILFSGLVTIVRKSSGTSLELNPQSQHLGCFLGGLMALGGKLFDRTQDLAHATKLVDGCVWAYKSSARGIMPEKFRAVPCPSKDSCQWDEAKWKQQVLSNHGHDKSDRDADAIIAKDRLPPGYTAIMERKYLLRPEAIESVFILYRATGRPDLAESAWDMFEAINGTTSTRLANSAVSDVTIPMEQAASPSDSMESFWLGETLKYFYLMFSEPDLISLDEFVFNTEAHPFRRLVR